MHAAPKNWRGTVRTTDGSRVVFEFDGRPVLDGALVDDATVTTYPRQQVSVQGTGIRMPMATARTQTPHHGDQSQRFCDANRNCLTFSRGFVPTNPSSADLFEFSPAGAPMPAPIPVPDGPHPNMNSWAFILRHPYDNWWDDGLYGLSRYGGYNGNTYTQRNFGGFGGDAYF